MEKDYSIEVDLKFTQLASAPNKKKAIEIVKDSFREDYNIELTDKEITKVEEV